MCVASWNSSYCSKTSRQDCSSDRMRAFSELAVASNIDCSGALIGSIRSGMDRILARYSWTRVSYYWYLSMVNIDQIAPNCYPVSRCGFPWTPAITCPDHWWLSSSLFWFQCNHHRWPSRQFWDYAVKHKSLEAVSLRNSFFRKLPINENQPKIFQRIQLIFL